MGVDKVGGMDIELRPLRDRVVAPAELPLLSHPDVAQWRSATESDIDGIWHLDRAIGRADHPNYLATREEVSEAFGFSHFHPELDSLVGLDTNGRIVANGWVVFPRGQVTLVRSFLSGGVHPQLRGRGIGRALLDWQLGRAKQQLASSTKTLPGWIQTFTDERAPQNARLYERGGLKLTRYFLLLERLLAAPIRSFDLASGIRIAQYTPDMSAAVHVARDEAFMDHWSSQPVSGEGWASFVGSEVFRPELSFVAFGPGSFGPGSDGPERVVGFTMTTVNEDDWESQGFSGSYIDLVGVLSGWRGKHIAQALLAAQMKASRALGHERVTLDVDSKSPTGALGLYTGMGFHPTNRDLAFVLEF